MAGRYSDRYDREERYERKRTRDDYDGSSRHKRGRYSDPGPRGRGEAVSTEEKLESLIVRLGEKAQASIDNNLESLSQIIGDELSEYKEKILQVITRCAREMGEKTTIYTTMVGLLNAKKFDIGEELVDLLIEELKLALGDSRFTHVKTLVRFLADLVNAKVVPTSSIMSLFDTFITVTYEPGITQLRSDWYTYIVLSALPWVAGELQSKRSAEFERLLSAIDNYMSKRRTAYLPSLQVWTTDRPVRQRERLEVLWAQIVRMKTDGWKDSTLRRPYESFESEISSAYTHPLPNIVVPSYSNESCYPLPSVVFSCFTDADLPPQYAQTQSFPPLESSTRYFAEELILCTINSHSSNRKHCALQLNLLMELLHHLPMEFMVAEVIFGLIFQLPSPPHSLAYYGSLIIELCKLRPASYPSILQVATNLLFTHIDHMNYIATERFSWWFSYHLSNYQYIWQWSTWSTYLELPPDHPNMLFMRESFARCTRLATYEVFSSECGIPECFANLLPSQPIPNFIYGEDEENGGMAPEYSVARTLVQSMRSKQPVEQLLNVIDTTATAMELPPEDPKVLLTKVSILTHCVLHVGEQTPTHCFTALHKFRSLFVELLDTEETKMTCLDSVAQFHCHNPQMHTLILDRLVRESIVDDLCIVEWMFKSEIKHDFTSRFCWEVLDGVKRRLSVSLKQALKELDKMKLELRKISSLDEATGGAEERQTLEWRAKEFEEKVEDRTREQREVFVAMCQGMVLILSDHLVHSDQEAVDYETSWFSCVLDHLRQLLVEVHSVT